MPRLLESYPAVHYLPDLLMTKRGPFIERHFQELGQLRTCAWNFAVRFVNLVRALHHLLNTTALCHPVHSQHRFDAKSFMFTPPAAGQARLAKLRHNVPPTHVTVTVSHQAGILPAHLRPMSRSCAA